MRKTKHPGTQPQPAKRKWAGSNSKTGRPMTLRTPVTKQVEVTALYLSGHKQREIGRQLGLNRETVRRIISRQESSILLQGYREAVMKIIPHALIGAYELVKRLDRQMITDILYGARVLIGRRETEEIKPPQERTYDYPKVEYFAKYGKWPSLAEAKEFEKTMDIEPLVKKES